MIDSGRFCSKWFTLRPDKWKWWHWFIPSKRKELKYCKIVERIVQSEIKLNEEKFHAYMSNVMLYGQCAGECGYEIIHGGLPEGKKENGKT